MDLSDSILKFNILSDNKIGQGLKMKKVSEILKKYKVAVIFAGFAVVFAGICIFCAVNLFSKPVIGFYGIDPTVQKSICSVIENWNKKVGQKFEFKTLDPSKTLESHFFLGKKPDLLFTVSGNSVKTAAEEASKKAAVSENSLQKMTSSIKMSAIRGENPGTVSALPLLTGNFEISINTSSFRTSGMNAIATWSDIERFLKIQKKKLDYPVIFAGKDSDLMLDFLGALTEAFDGVAEYKKAVEIIEHAKNKKWKVSEVAEQLCGSYNAPLYASAKQLSKWYNAGLLNRDVFNLSQKDVNAFLQARLATMVFMPLSQHRTVENRTIERFSTIYFPSEKAPGERSFTAEIIYAVPQKKNRLNTLLIEYLNSDSGQEDLSRATGLAPVFAQCRTPDRQADDVRYWVAATNAPLAGLSREVALSKKQKDELARELAAKIKFGQFE